MKNCCKTKNCHAHEHAHGDERDHSTDCCEHGHGKREGDCCGHSHEHGEDGCGCGKERDKKTLLKNCVVIGAAVALIILGLTVPVGKYVKLAFYIPAYLIVGWEYLYTAVKNILKGKVFDENFLMTVATIGAFAIGEYAEAALVMLLYYVGETFQSLAVSRSKKSVSSLLDLKSETAHLVENGVIRDVSPDMLKIGDIVSVGAGEKLPADGTVISGSAWLDYAALNGEYMPKEAVGGFGALGGSIVKDGAITLKITKPFKDTTAAKIIDLVENSQDKKPKSEKFITRFAKWYTPAVVFAALVIAFVVPAFVGYDKLAEWVGHALVFLVISCPCALVISVPLSFFAGIGGASKNGALVKGGNCLDDVNAVDTVVFDKTGTLTMGAPHVTNIYAEKDEELLIRLAAHAEAYSNHPLASAVKNRYNEEIKSDSVSDYREIAGKGVSATIEGRKVLCGSAKLLAEYGISAELPKSDNGTMIYLAADGEYLGALDINDEIKPEAAELVALLKSKGIDVIMMTGDESRSASYVAEKLGIEKVFSGLLPDGKAQKIEELNAEGKKVMFVGDGLNDAPVLSLAFLGVCIGGMNNDASVEAADIVIIGGLDGVKNLFAVSAKTKRIVTQNIVFSLAVKVAIMALSLTILPQMWLAILADVGVSLLAIGNATRALRLKKRSFVLKK